MAMASSCHNSPCVADRLPLDSPPLSWLAVAVLPFEDRVLLASAVEVSLETGEPIPTLAELRREREEYGSERDVDPTLSFGGPPTVPQPSGPQPPQSLRVQTRWTASPDHVITRIRIAATGSRAGPH